MGIMMQIAVGIGVTWRTAQAGSGADRRFIKPPPECRRPHEGLVVEAGRQHRRQKIRHCADVEPQRRKAVLAPRPQSVEQRNLGRTQVGCHAAGTTVAGAAIASAAIDSAAIDSAAIAGGAIAGGAIAIAAIAIAAIAGITVAGTAIKCHQSVRFLRAGGNDAARPVVFERPGNQMHIVREQGGRQGIALATRERLAVEAERQRAVAANTAAGCSAEWLGHSASGRFWPTR